MATSVALKCIKTGTKLPDGILLGYPAFYISPNTFTLSTLISLDDQIMRHTNCDFIKAYIKENNPLNPYISPSEIKDFDLKSFPKVRFLISERDHLRDMIYCFAY